MQGGKVGSWNVEGGRWQAVKYIMKHFKIVKHAFSRNVLYKFYIKFPSLMIFDLLFIGASVLSVFARPVLLLLSNSSEPSTFSFVYNLFII